jgi:acetyl-CoA acetyltransferase
MMARMISECDFEVPYGTFIPALYALIATQFMAERGITREDIARVAVSARKWALLNPKARMHGKGPIEIADVINSRPIAEPFHFLDCSIPSDGGGVVLVTRADIAQQISSRPAYVRGYGEYHPRGTISGAGNLVESGATVSGPEAFRRAGMTPADIDIVQLYDAFSATPLILLENLGFCGPGTSGKFVQSGATDPGGRLPMNTNGGLLSFGHTGDASGMSVLIEGARQVMGQAGLTQVEKADRVLVHCYGGMMFDHATLILAREP